MMPGGVFVTEPIPSKPTLILPMKNIARIFTLTLATLLVSAAAWAQGADDAYKAYKSLRDDKAATPNSAYYQKLCAAGLDYLTAFPGDKRVREVVNSMLGYGTGVLAKDKVQRAAWYSQVQFAIVDKQFGLDEKTRAPLAALSAAVAEGEVADNPTGQMVSDWRGKIDQLASLPGTAGLKLDREKGFCAMMSRVNAPWAAKLVDAQLADLAAGKDKDAANWAKQEIKVRELRKTPFTLSFTTADGKAFDSSALKGNPSLYVYFLAATGKNAAKDAETLLDAYFEFSRRQVEFVVVLCDPEDKRADALAFVKKQKIKCPVYFDGAGSKGELYQKLAVSSVPGGYLFNGKGGFVDRNIKPGDLKKYIR